MRYVPDPCQGEVQGPGDRCSRKAKDVHTALQLLHPFLLLHTKAVFLIDNEQGELLEGDIVGQEPMRPDDQINRPRRDVSNDAALLRCSYETGEHTHIYRQGSQTRPEGD